jgi:hypothetical protein
MNARYITDSKGKKVGVVLPLESYKKMLSELEELADIKAYDRAKARKSRPIPFKQAIKDLALLRNGRNL